MFYKRDWPETKKRYKAWWKGELSSRPLIQVRAPRQKPLKESACLAVPKGNKTENLKWVLLDWVESCNIKENWKEPVLVLNKWELYFGQTWFGGDSFPQLWPNLGPGVVAAYLTDFLSFNGDTAWLELPTPLGWKEILNLKFDPDNKWWQLTKRLAEVLTRSAKGKFIVGLPDLGGPIDILASLRGTQNLLVDLIEHPQEIKEASSLLLELWLHYYQELHEIMQKGAEGGSSAWMSIWAPGRWYPLQGDFAAMISSQMFEEFVISGLEKQCRYLDNAIYHLDGPGQIDHLDLLLDISELDGIQWSPGAGNPSVGSPQWFPLYKKIQKKNKLLTIFGIAAEEIEPLLNEISPEGLLLSINCSSEEEARILLEKVQ